MCLVILLQSLMEDSCGAVRYRVLTFLISISVAASGGFIVLLDSPEAAQYPRDKDPSTLAGPPKEYEWDSPPPVVVCEDSLVSREQIKAAMGFWQERGHEFGELFFHKDPDTLCRTDIPSGHIVVRLANYEVRAEMAPDTLAETRFNTKETSSLAYAKVFMLEEPRERVMEHELGHALGFLHYNVAGHLMHIKSSVGGWDDFGLGHMTPEVRAEWERTVDRPDED